MQNLENRELQIKLINKITKLNNNKLLNKNIHNKLCYLLSINNKKVNEEIIKVNGVLKIIDKSLEVKNYKKALRYSCYLSSIIDNIIEQVEI